MEKSTQITSLMDVFAADNIHFNDKLYYMGHHIRYLLRNEEKYEKFMYKNVKIRKDKIILPNGIKFYFRLGHLKEFFGSVFEIFMLKDYDIDVKGKTVVDVGSAFGDSSIYFASKGARKVYAYDADTALYEELKKNIVLNKFQKIVVPERRFVNYNYFYNKILPQVHGPAVLKMDIEGGEYDILSPQMKKSIQKFSTIILEYHYGYIDIKQRLEKLGYKVKIKSVATMRSGSKRMVTGYLLATREK